MTEPAVPERGWYRYPIGLWVATRVSLLLLGHVSLVADPRVALQGGAFALRPYPALDALCRWDCGWFEHIARFGYTQPRLTNFWPGLPLLARALTELTGLPTHLTVLVVPNLACLGAYLVLYRIYARIDGEPAARWALALFAAFPFAFFHAAGYPETLMILLSAAAVLLAMQGRHTLAGIALGLGVLSRHLTILLGGALLAAQIRQRGLRGLLRDARVLTLALPFALAGIYMAWQARRYGDPLLFWKARDTWGGTAWWSVLDVLQVAAGWPHIAVLPVFALLPTAGALLLLRRARYAELAAAVLPLVAVLWMIGAFGLGRYAASCWPAFLPLGRWLAGRPRLQAPVLLALALAQGWFFYLHSHHYEIQ